MRPKHIPVQKMLFATMPTQEKAEKCQRSDSVTDSIKSDYSSTCGSEYSNISGTNQSNGSYPAECYSPKEEDCSSNDDCGSAKTIESGDDKDDSCSLSAYSDSDYSDSNYDSSDYSSSDEDVDELLAELNPIKRTVCHRTQNSTLSSRQNFPSCFKGLELMQQTLDKPSETGALPEGLPLLESLRAELEKVGQAVICQKSGEAFVERARILAAINLLASHVPSSVLDVLGQEIRKNGLKKPFKFSNDSMKDDLDCTDNMSDVSDVTETSEQQEFYESFNGSQNIGEAEDVVDDDQVDNEERSHLASLPSSPWKNKILLEPAQRETSQRVPARVHWCHNSLTDDDFLVGEGNNIEGSFDGAPPLADSSTKQCFMSPLGRRKPFYDSDGGHMSRSLSMGSFVLSSMGHESQHSPPRVPGRQRKLPLQNRPSDKSKGVTASSSVELLNSRQRTFSPSRQALIRRNKSSLTLATFYESLDNLPPPSYFQCALLMVDISGFTKLSTMLDPERLSKVINAYFQSMIQKIFEYNGDVLKFAGDAFYAEWRSSPTIKIDQCVASATACAANIVSMCCDIPIMKGGSGIDGETVVSWLNVHCAVGVGEILGVHVGNNKHRREYVFLGDPIDQVTSILEKSNLGEVAGSPPAMEILQKAGFLDNSIKPSKSNTSVIAKREVTMFKMDLFMEKGWFCVGKDHKCRGVTAYVDGLDIDKLKEYQRVISLYVHPVISSMYADLQKSLPAKTNISSQERSREEAELRSVYTMFLKPLLTFSLRGNINDDDIIISLLNNIMNLTTSELIKYGGHLRQFIYDDKGLVLIATFGLRGSTCPDMVSESALPATIALRDTLRDELGVDCRIGAAFGDVYCGAVGADNRHEYAVLGPPANLAARLMSLMNNPGVLVDDSIKRMASRIYAFNALAPVKAKGYADLVPIFEPLRQIERSWGRIQPNFVGRTEEITTLMRLARSISGSKSPTSKLAILASEHGMGKTTTIAHSIEHIRRIIGTHPSRLMITKKVGKESDKFVPFGFFKSVLHDVVSRYHSHLVADDNKSLASAWSSANTIAENSLPTLSCGSCEFSEAQAASINVLVDICRDLNASRSCSDHFMHHMTGQELPHYASKPPTTDSMVNFMSRAFRTCTHNCELVIVALDDIHYADEMSWKVFQKIFETANNVLFICSSSLALRHDFGLDLDFWDYLNGECKEDGRFVWMELHCLSEEEVAQMTSKTLGQHENEVLSDVINEVITLSGGWPHFVHDCLENIKRRLENGGEELTSQSVCRSVPEMLLLRIDSMNISVRNVLNMGAVFGTPFSMDDVTAVLKENDNDLSEDDITSEATKALKWAVEEGILVTSSKLGSNLSRRLPVPHMESNEVYCFRHEVWKSTLLGLMLDSRKRDLHKKIAQSMEARMSVELMDFSTKMKLLSHFKAGGFSSKVTKLALSMGKHLAEKLGMPSQSIRIYRQALEPWQEDSSSEEVVGGIRLNSLKSVNVSVLVNIVKIKLAMGKAYFAARRYLASVLAYQDALQILLRGKASSAIKDRSFVFIAYDALYRAAKLGHIQQDKDKLYEKALVRKFMFETRCCGSKFHHIHALSVQVDLDSRNSQYTKAVAVLSMIRRLYKYETHSKVLRDFYGHDCALTLFSRSAVWHMHIGNKNAAIQACHYVIQKLMPKLDLRDNNECFLMIFPLLIAMKDFGLSSDARNYFDKYVSNPFHEDHYEGKSIFFLPLFEPIKMLLTLVGKESIEKKTLGEYLAFALDTDRLRYGTLVNIRLGRLGQCADSMSAEICYHLALRVKHTGMKNVLLENGTNLALEALEFNCVNGLTSAEKQVHKVLKKISSVS